MNEPDLATKEGFAFLGLLTAIALILAIITAVLFLPSTINEIRQEAIDRDYALYCPKDGQFAWKGECAL